ncbi:UNVERIFIED_CONTAM: hypothetical protein GTU68_059489 [Idotea baltica]|nr:hypothetical protein [Idotea baltica]
MPIWRAICACWCASGWWPVTAMMRPLHSSSTVTANMSCCVRPREAPTGCCGRRDR